MGLNSISKVTVFTEKYIQLDNQMLVIGMAKYSKIASL